MNQPVNLTAISSENPQIFRNIQKFKQMYKNKTRIIIEKYSENGEKIQKAHKIIKF